MGSGRLARFWPYVKLTLALVIIGFVGWQFAKSLNNPAVREYTFPVRPGWWLLGGVLYLLGLGCSNWFWVRVLAEFGQRPDPVRCVRAYFIGHLGKYVPGKAWSLLLRSTLASGPGVSAGAAAVTATYETLSLMTAGAVMAVILVLVEGEHIGGGVSVWAALGLLGLAGVPILPGVFNRIVAKLVSRFRTPGAPPWPPLGGRALLLGIAVGSAGWLFLGASLWAVFNAVLADPPGWSVAGWLRVSAMSALAYVAGFVIAVSPGGLGTRDFILTELLTLEFLADQITADRAAAAALATLSAVCLRLLWTVSEVVAAGAVYWLPVSPAPTTAPNELAPLRRSASPESPDPGPRPPTPGSAPR